VDNAPGYSTQFFANVASRDFVKILLMDYVVEIFINAFLIQKEMSVCRRQRIGAVFLLKGSVPLRKIQESVSIAKTFVNQIISLTYHVGGTLRNAQIMIASVPYQIPTNVILVLIHQNAVEGQNFALELQAVIAVKTLINVLTLTMFAKAFLLVEAEPLVQ
jgi:hypothetical protein